MGLVAQPDCCIAPLAGCGQDSDGCAELKLDSHSALSLGFSGAVAQIRGAVGVGVGGSPPGEARAAKFF